jgi:hypothetical protein
LPTDYADFVCSACFAWANDKAVCPSYRAYGFNKNIAVYNETLSNINVKMFVIITVYKGGAGYSTRSKHFVFWHGIQHNATIKTLRRGNIPRRASGE